ncbi:hypothetical protein SY83_22350 [Paenibacillus swuensis]|uniref:Methyl-accepting transducer domain-containing protein n=1 Tax=Paenibacillus swuensis TaxID=1178515 RepID=A0A172TQM9_9BACL|nr:hypothetical protein SY83_22350 [Paenibacillus swuensis]
MTAAFILWNKQSGDVGITSLNKENMERDISIETVVQFVNESQVVSDQLNAAIEEVNLSIEGLNRVADSSTQIEEQLRNHSRLAVNRINEAFSSLQEVAAAADQISDTSAYMNTESQSTQTVVMHVVQSLTKTNEVMDSLRSYNQTMDERIRELSDHASKIEEINSFIQGVVSQTSLLALNASIEAAHAGEYGRGFAVVAQQIKKLAEQSNEAVKRSSLILNSIEQGVGQVVASVEQEKLAVARGLDEMQNIQHSMDDIFNRISQVNHLVGQTNDSSTHQTSLMAESTNMLQDVVYTVNNTLESVEVTLHQLNTQRTEINKLQRVNEKLKSSSSELIHSIQQVGVTSQTQQVDMDLEPMRTLLGAIASDPKLAGLDERSHAEGLTRYMKANAEIEAIWSNRADGSFVFSLPEAGLLNAKGREWWKQAMDGHLYLSPVYISAITKKPCITMSKVILDPSGNPAGVVGMDLIIS